MPPRSVPKTAVDFIYYYYAKLVIAPSAGQAGNYRFIMDRYKHLRSGSMHMSDYDREIQRLARRTGICAYCEKRDSTIPTEVVPRKLGGPIGIHNLVHACRPCSVLKANRDLIEWWCQELEREIDELPRIPIGLYLKLTYERRAIEFSLRKPCEDIGQLWPGGGG